MVTRAALFRECVSALSVKGIENARFEAEQLVTFVCHLSTAKLIASGDEAVPENETERVRELLARRLKGEPLQYLIGMWEFYGLPFYVGEGVLIPRQDTETLAETALDFCKGKGFSLKAADLCAGSGCLGVTLAVKAGIEVDCCELYESAAGYLVQNIALNGVEALVMPILGDVLSEETVNAAQEYDIIISNPPYLTAEDMRTLQREVAFEPKEALYGGEDGLGYYRKILPLWVKKLKSGGLFAMEIGAGMENEVSRIFCENGIEPMLKKDCCGFIRVVYGIKT